MRNFETIRQQIAASNSRGFSKHVADIAERSRATVSRVLAGEIQSAYLQKHICTEWPRWKREAEKARASKRRAAGVAA